MVSLPTCVPFVRRLNFRFVILLYFNLIDIEDRLANAGAIPASDSKLDQEENNGHKMGINRIRSGGGGGRHRRTASDSDSD